MEKQKNNKANNKYLVTLLIILGIILTTIYIFYTSTTLKTSDSIITNAIAHYEMVNKEFILSNWHYGNELFVFNLNIPIMILSLVIKNNILISKIITFIVSIMFFFLLYKFSKKFLNTKKERLTLILIFLSGISYSVLNYFYSFDSVLITIFNSMLLLYMYYKCLEENANKKFYIITLIFTFLLCIGTYKYFSTVIIPIIVMELYRCLKKEKKVQIKVNSKRLIGIIGICLVAISCFLVLTNNYNYKNENGGGSVSEIENKNILKKVINLADINFSFFGFDNRNNSFSEIAGESFFLKQHKDYCVYSIDGFFLFIKMVVFILFMIITPICLFKNYRKNSKQINFLLVFNTISWLIMIINYIFGSGYYYISYDLQYFLFNFIINIILGIYFINECFAKEKLLGDLCNIVIIFYLISNFYSTSITIFEHDSMEIDHKYATVNTLKENNLTFGYGEYWNSLLTNYLSNYKIEVVGVTLGKKISPNELYTDKRWYKKVYHRGKTFLILDESSMGRLSYYNKRYGRPDEMISTADFLILVYNENPFLKDLR